jgi:hypothetical protein
VFDWITDKTIDDGCSKRRPDMLVDLGTHIIIVEVDENKHSSYDCSCENKRIMELSQDVHHRSIVFIRFNPDKYTDINGKTVPSCWKYTKHGVLVINAKPEWDNRMSLLKNEIRYWVSNATTKIVEIVEVCY